MFKTINNLLKIVVLSLIATILILSYTIVTEFGYQNETELINDAYTSINIPPPTWNATTRYFEYRDNTTYYIGYIKFKNMEYSRLEIIEFKNASVIKHGSTYSFASIDNEFSVIYSEELLRKFKSPHFSFI